MQKEEVWLPAFFYGECAVISLWLKIGYTLFVCVLVPIYWRRYGPANFLWFSDIALLAMVPALWLENALLASTMAVSVIFREGIWNIDFFVRLATGTLRSLCLSFPPPFRADA